MEKSDCKDPQVLQPRIHLGRCEAKNECVDVCPYDVFEVRRSTPGERAGMTWLEGLKSFAHGHKKAFVVRPEQCHSCGLCVPACPEQAIQLERATR